MNNSSKSSPTPTIYLEEQKRDGMFSTAASQESPLRGSESESAFAHQF
jgi:hypothetical protein